MNLIDLKSTLKIVQATNKIKGRILTSKLAIRMLIMLLLIFILFGGISVYKIIKGFNRPFSMPVISVSSTQATYQEWQPKLHAIGNLRATQGVDLTPELAGLVKSIHFTPGTTVNEGDVLVQLNADAEIGQLNSLRAQAKLAEITYKRNKAQFAAKAISQAVLDNDQADLENKQAQVEQQEAVVAKKTIRAPFAGKLGISSINLGQYLNPGDKVVTLQSLNPIYIDFYLPQQSLALVQVGQAITFETDVYAGQTFQGKITAIDPKIDSSTRNVQVEVTVENPDLKLLPGMYGTIDIYTGEAQKHLVLPKTSISFNPYGEIVYTIHETGKDKKEKPILSVKQTFVTVGESRGDQIAVLKGLKEGDHVVTAGQLKLKNGSVVEINNSIVPKNDPKPNLKDD